MSTKMEVPFVDLKAQYQSIKEEVNRAVLNLMESTNYIGGKAVADFEAGFCRLQKVKNTLGVANGTDGLFIALKALGIGRGDFVITAANSFIASSEAITMAGATPVFIDADPQTYNIDIQKLETYLSNNASKQSIKAIIPVHLYGLPANMPAIIKLADKFNLKIVEDCAQAHLAQIHGKTVGTFGQVGSFSFYPGKNLGAYGDGGCLTSEFDEVAKKMRMWANHGRISKYDHEFEGVNSRLDAIQAVVLSEKMKHIERWTEQRIKAASLYNQLLADVPEIVCPLTPEGYRHVFHLYVIRTNQRETLAHYLQENGIATGVHYPIALPNLKAYQYLNLKFEDYPVATAYQSQILSLPMFPELTEEQVTFVATHIKKFFQTHRK